MKYFLVGLGAAFGGTFRFWLSNFIYKFLPAVFPYGTLGVNILGSFILGIIIFYFDDRNLLSPNIKLFLTIGFCGGFTTFSTFSFETFKLMQDSEFLFAALNIFLNLILCIGSIVAAYFISKLI